MSQECMNLLLLNLIADLEKEIKKFFKHINMFKCQLIIILIILLIILLITLLITLLTILLITLLIILLIILLTTLLIILSTHLSTCSAINSVTYLFIKFLTKFLIKLLIKLSIKLSTNFFIKLSIKFSFKFLIKLSIKFSIKFSSNLHAYYFIKIDCKNIWERIERVILFLIHSILYLVLNWSLSQVFISTFWLNSSTWYQCHDSAWILDINLMTQLNIDLKSSQNSSSWLNLLSNQKFRIQLLIEVFWAEFMILLIDIFRTHDSWEYWLLLIEISQAEFMILLINIFRTHNSWEYWLLLIKIS